MSRVREVTEMEVDGRKRLRVGSPVYKRASEQYVHSSDVPGLDGAWKPTALCLVLAKLHDKPKTIPRDTSGGEIHVDNFLINFIFICYSYAAGGSSGGITQI